MATDNTTTPQANTPTTSPTRTTEPPTSTPTPQTNTPASPTGRSVLREGEKEVVFFEGRVPVKACLGRHGLLYVLLLGWNLGLLIAWVQSWMTTLRLTSQRVVIIRGLISRDEEDIPLYRGSDINFSQTVAGRLFGTGVIVLHSDDVTSPRATFAIPRPQELKEKLRESMNKERIRYRSRIID